MNGSVKHIRLLPNNLPADVKQIDGTTGAQCTHPVVKHESIREQ